MKSIKHVHMLGIGGTGMGALAGLLKAAGYTVTGSDGPLYPPMSTQIEKLGIEPFVGFSPSNLEPRPDIAIIGNVLRKDNPEAVAVIEKKIPYLSMPQALAQLFLDGKEPIVVTGTHGKTTISNIIAWILSSAQKDPGFLIGGVGLNFGESFKLGAGKYFVIEGDEYDTAFFDKGPKFLHYRPKMAIISSIEFDHADIYKDLDAIKSSFSKFLEIIPSNGFCVVNADDEVIGGLLHHAHCRIMTYGFSQHADYRIIVPLIRPERVEGLIPVRPERVEGRNIHPSTSSLQTTGGQAGRTSFFAIVHSGITYEFETPLSGRHNLANAASVLALLMELGIDVNTLAEGLKTFRGVRRRQEIRGIVNSVTVIDDFAHHPTAIRETIRAMKEKYPKARLWAIFEPRSNTTRRKIFENEMASAFFKADKSILAGVFHSTDIPEAERLSPEKVVESINQKRGNAYFIPETGNIVEFVVRTALPGDVVLIMSNGAFDNIHEKLLEGLKKRKFGG